MFPLPKLGPLLSVDHFLPHVGRSFHVTATPAPVDICLEQILRRPGSVWMAREPFLLVFSSPWNVLLVEAHYRMAPEGAEPIEMHLIPSHSMPAERRYYHAVFN